MTLAKYRVGDPVRVTALGSPRYDAAGTITGVHAAALGAHVYTVTFPDGIDWGFGEDQLILADQMAA